MNNSARVSGGGPPLGGSLFGCLSLPANTALQGGGAAPNLLVNCTVVGNSAPSDGGVGGGLGGGVLGRHRGKLNPDSQYRHFRRAELS